MAASLRFHVPPPAKASRCGPQGVVSTRHPFCHERDDRQTLCREDPDRRSMPQAAAQRIRYLPGAQRAAARPANQVHGRDQAEGDRGLGNRGMAEGRGRVRRYIRGDAEGMDSARRPSRGARDERRVDRLSGPLSSSGGWAEVFVAGTLIEATKDNWRAAAFVAERLWPDQWGRRDTSLVNQPAGDGLTEILGGHQPAVPVQVRSRTDRLDHRGRRGEHRRRHRRGRSRIG